MSRRKSKFTLNPKHENFVLGETPLELNSVNDLPNFAAFVTVLMAFPVLLIMTCGMIAVAVIGIGREVLFKYDSALTEAQITECKVISSVRSSYHFFYYSYKVDDQEYKAGAQTITNSCAPHAPGVRFQLRYMRADPTFSRIAGDDGGDFSISGPALIASLPMGAASLWFVRALVRYPKVELKMRRLRERGLLLEGRIVSVRGWDISIFTRHPTYTVTVTYQFESPDQVVLTGTSSNMRTDLLNKRLPRIGSEVTVLYADDQTHMML